jgi:hypothetical protein
MGGLPWPIARLDFYIALIATQPPGELGLFPGNKDSNIGLVLNLYESGRLDGYKQAALWLARPFPVLCFGRGHNHSDCGIRVYVCGNRKLGHELFCENHIALASTSNLITLDLFDS